MNYHVISTFLILLSGILLYSENIIGLFVNLDKPIPNFVVLRNLIYAMGSSISPFLLLFGGRMNPHRLSYISPIYAYMNVIAGNILLALEYDVMQMWWFRICIFGFSIMLLYLLVKISNFYNALELSNKMKDKLISSYKNKSDESKDIL